MSTRSRRADPSDLRRCGWTSESLTSGIAGRLEAVDATDEVDNVCFFGGIAGFSSSWIEHTSGDSAHDTTQLTTESRLTLMRPSWPSIPSCPLAQSPSSKHHHQGQRCYQGSPYEYGVCHPSHHCTPLHLRSIAQKRLPLRIAIRIRVTISIRFDQTSTILPWLSCRGEGRGGRG